MSDRELPKSVETEQTLLGCVLNDISKFIEIDDLLDESDFYVNRHKKIYRAIKELINKGDQVDLITLIEYLKTKKELMECGGASYLTELSTSAINYSNAINYVNIIKEKAKRRILIKAGQNLMAKGFDTDVNSLVEETENKLFEVMNSNKRDIISIQDAMEKTFISLEERFKNKDSLKGISTGFTEIDELSSGLNRSDFIVIAARPSMGKTAFALNIGQAASQFGSVAVFSIEMSTDQLMDRLLAARCLIDYGDIKKGNLNDDEFNKIIQESVVLNNRKMFIDEDSRLINDIKAKCRKLKIQKGLDVVIIDYLQLITTTQKINSREQEVSYISKELKALAKELNITVIALSQLSRAPEQRADHRPILSDLRESGSIEQDADIIHFLYRDEYYNKETEDKNIAEVITAKNRNGVTRTTKLVWLGQYQRFGSLDVIRE